MALSVVYQGRNHVLAATDQDGQPLNLARALWRNGLFPIRPLCMGIGSCGLCRVLFHSPAPEPTPSELKILSAEELERGMRLACRHQAADGLHVEIMTQVTDGPCTTPGFSSADAPLPMQASGRDNALRLAVDLGTTSLAWQADDAEGNTLAAGQQLNPQMYAGSDVMARLAEAMTPAGALRLQSAVTDFLKKIVASLGECGWNVVEIGLAANPAMTALALGLDTSGLRSAPYRMDDAGGREQHLPGLPPLWIPPQISPFVGGDVSCGLALLLSAPRPFLLADMGTNGEFLLVQDHAPLLAASVPLGPALEGVGMRCGGLAGPGAVTSFHAGPVGLEAVTYDGGAPKHISGTGYLSLLQCLRGMGLLDGNGHFAVGNGHFSLGGQPGHTTGPLDFLRKKLAHSIYPHPQDKELRLPLPGNLFLSAGDVENLLKVKAAFSLAIEGLLREAALEPGGLDQLYLAGALGLHAPLAALEDLAFLPPGLARKTTALGNASLQGMALLLRSASSAFKVSEPSTSASAAAGDTGQNLRIRLEQAIVPRRVLDLASDPLFHQDYIRHMRFEPTE